MREKVRTHWEGAAAAIAQRGALTHSHALFLCFPSEHFSFCIYCMWKSCFSVALRVDSGARPGSTYTNMQAAGSLNGVVRCSSSRRCIIQQRCIRKTMSCTLAFRMDIFINIGALAIFGLPLIRFLARAFWYILLTATKTQNTLFQIGGVEEGIFQRSETLKTF